MNLEQRSKSELGWPINANIKVFVADFFEYGGRIHNSEVQAYYFENEDDLQGWISQYGKRAVKDGPVEIMIQISDWPGRGKGRHLQAVYFENPDFVHSKKRA